MSARNPKLNEFDGCCEEKESNAQSLVPIGISKRKCQPGGQKDRQMFDVVRDICYRSIFWRNYRENQYHQEQEPRHNLEHCSYCQCLTAIYICYVNS